MRVFLDTNVLVSALATRGLCADLFESILAEHDLLTSPAVLEELRRILSDKFRMPADLVQASIEFVDSGSERITATVPISVPVPDPDDVVILEAAVPGASACFVTGDAALLELGAVEGMLILSPRQFWDRFHIGR